jgi:glycosyltransferase involved in cell wall biosynthesis
MARGAAVSNLDVTVVVTNYNYARFLGEAVASALAQEGGPPHVIVVDDGSTEPDTEAALAALPAEVTVIRQANAGLSAARNAGIAGAETPYVIVLDADDKLAPIALRTLKDVLEADAGLGFAYGLTRFFGDWNEILAMPDYDPYKLLYRHMIGSTALMRRVVWEQNGGFAPEIRGYEDWDFWLGALAHGWQGRRVHVETFYYRRHGVSMISGARRDYRHWYRRLRERHAALYRDRARLARESGVGLVEQWIYRFFWGPRPLPAAVEQRIHALLFRG